MSTVDRAAVKPFGFRPEFVAEQQSADGGSLYRFTFAPDGDAGLSEDFYRFVTTHLAKMNYDHITIHCPNGHPEWLTSFFTKLNAYGLPVEVTPAPTAPTLIAAIENAARYTRFKWQDTHVAPVLLAPAQKANESTQANAGGANGVRRAGRFENALSIVLVILILVLIKEPIQEQLARGTTGAYVIVFIIAVVAILLATQARTLVRTVLNRKR